MSDVKHTPGPWTVTSDGFIAAPSDQMNEGYYVASLHGYAERSANASLISAAPEMLEALMEARAQMQHLYGKTNVLDRIDAAIAKAEAQP